ncbi:MAG: peptide deformylase [Deltaproteobacteria bacterium]|jgi:peptide deformylase|nr:peptide deformylase [Deltaproteobacteria bacterium]
MARLPLVIYPDEILTRPSAEVTEIDQDIVDFIANMRETMYASNGIGLAAPQVARNIRIMTIDVDPDQGGKSFMHLINPIIVEGHGKTSYDEGCLSFPGLVAEVRRKKTIHVQGYDLSGRLLDFEADGLLAICFQHELDHLNGVTFVDRLSPVQKTLVVRDYLKRREEDEEDKQIADILRMHGVASEREAAEAGEAVLKTGVRT